MSQLDYTKDEFNHLEHSTSIDSTKKITPSSNVHIPKNLANMANAPTAAVLQDAVEFAEGEKVMPLKAAFKNELWGLLYCLCFVLPAIGQGLDSGVGSISVNMPAFAIKFGVFNPITKHLVIPSLWLSLWNASSSLGNAIGSVVTGAVTDRFGYRKAQIMGCVWSIATVFLQVFAHNRIMILMGKLLNGISMGMFVAVSAGYISEVTGARTRGTLMSILAAAPIIGIITGVGIGSDSRIIGNVGSDWGSWRLIFATQWIFPAITIPLVYLCPESPIRLVRGGDPERALASLKRIRQFESDTTASLRLAATQLTVAQSMDQQETEAGSYMDCFRGIDLKRTITVIVLLCSAQLSGTPLLSNGLYFLAQTGLAFSTVSQISLGFLGLSAIFCIFASFLLEKLGRRNTFVYGSLGHALLMITIGATYYLKSKGGLIASAMLFNLGISTAVMSTTATGYALAGEIPSVRLRSKTQSLGFGAYYVLGWGLQFAVPYMFQVAPEGAGWGVRACWLFAGFTLLCSVFGFFYVGETQGRSFADIDELYHRGVSPRKFASTQVQAERDAVA